MITAYGITDPITPECGAWGQGAVESPIGWLALMCWLSQYVEMNSSQPYTITVKGEKTKFTKTIYADDGTYFQTHRKGIQKIMVAIDEFSAAVGIIVKPTKSYTYSTKEMQPITSITWEGKEKYQLGKETITKLTQLQETDFFRHLGNIQNAEGTYISKPIQMYDKSESDSLYKKIKNDVKALGSRAITLGGTVQMLHTVLYRRIIYPLTFAAVTEKQVTELQQMITKLIRRKAKLSKRVPSELLFTHENMGGLGLDTVETIVNLEKLFVVKQCLYTESTLKALMLEAIIRMEKYMKHTNCLTATDSTQALIEPQGNWLYGMKKWMEKVGIKIHNTTEDRPMTGVMNWCTRKTSKQRVWQWARKNKVEQIADILDADLEIRTWMFNKDEKDVEDIMREAIGTWKSKGSPHVGDIGSLRQGCWVKNKDQIAKIQRITADKIKVKIKLGRLGLSKMIDTWHEGDCIEIKSRRKTQACGERKVKDPDNIKEDKEEESILEPTTNIAGGLINLMVTSPTVLTDLYNIATNPDVTIVIGSDGSVRNSIQMGTFVWTVAIKENGIFQPIGLECRGKEYVYGLEIHENHSYRMESLALLSGLTYFHQELKWKGKLEWYTDAKSVKDTYEGTIEYTFSKWNKQRDKDVWEAITQLKPIWKDRINLIHVESHMDTKLKKRNIERELSQPELLNIMADKIADAAYTTDMPWLNKKSMALARSTTISMFDNMITGNWRTEIKEQIIEKTKQSTETPISLGSENGRNRVEIYAEKLEETYPQ